MSNSEAGRTDKQRIPRSVIHGFIFFIFLLILMAAWSVYYDKSLVDHNDWESTIPYLMPAFFALIIIGAYACLFSARDSSAHRWTQLFILLITIASFYAFGWPKQLNPENLNQSFPELCIITVLFLLAELAAYLTIASAQIVDELRGTGSDITESLNKVAGDTVSGIREETDPIGKNLQSLAGMLRTEELAKSVEALGNIFGVIKTIEVLESPTARHVVLTEISKYTDAWATFLHSLEIQKDDPNKLRIDCGERILKKYIAAEIGDGSAFGHRRIVTVDKLYSSILREVLEAHERRLERGENVFAWAITNVPPYGFYHWGDKYGHPGSLDFMEEFRKVVLDLVNKNQTYERLFLFRDDERPAHDQAIAGLSLEPAYVIREFKDKVLLKVRKAGAPPLMDDVPWKKEVWVDLKVWGYLKGRADDATNAFHGIVNKSVCFEDGRHWIMDKDNDVRLMGIFRNYVVQPTPFLQHFEHTYQSKLGMAFMPVANREELPPQLRENPDCLIVGTVRDQTVYHPIMAISSSVVPTTNTMRMDIYTAENDLHALYEFWQQSKPERLSLSKFLDEP